MRRLQDPRGAPARRVRGEGRRPGAERPQVPGEGRTVREGRTRDRLAARIVPRTSGPARGGWPGPTRCDPDPEMLQPAPSPRPAVRPSGADEPATDGKDDARFFVVMRRPP